MTRPKMKILVDGETLRKPDALCREESWLLHLRRLNHVDDNKRDVILLVQQRRLPNAYLGEQLIR